jgi:hypothetical protein
MLLTVAVSTAEIATMAPSVVTFDDAEPDGILLCPLTLELAQVVTVFANVHIMSRALHCQVVHLSRVELWRVKG